ncbi:MAG: TetR/AcrR family transcriptional regulator [Spirochaetes bacterium]|nr:TetR/AcrR family transcriptional regulator [Spirochaetota bacterium]
MKRVEKNQQIRTKIIEAARTLFIQQSYSNTTIRQILKKTGITTGSLYHFFKNKESILRQITEDYLIDTDKIIRSFMKEYDPMVHYILIIYIQLKLIDSNPNLADIWQHTYSLWSITEMVCTKSAKWNKMMFGKYNQSLSDDDWYARSMAINSLIHYITIEKINKGKIPIKNRVHLLMYLVSSLFNTPFNQIESAIAKAEKIISKNSLQLYGVNIKL